MTLSERKALQGMNGVVARVKQTTPRVYPAPVHPPRTDDSGALGQKFAPISPEDPLNAARGIIVGVLLGALLWLPIGAWISRFVTP